jgi:hypothetical protein
MSLSAALLATLVLLGAPAVGQTDDPPPDLGASLSQWSPGREWTVTNDSDTEGSRGGCDEGRVIQWADDTGRTAGFVWARCGDPRTATELLNLAWASNGMFPAPDLPPAFGDGLELVSPYPGFDGVNRLWTQGEWYLAVASSCPIGALPECSRFTADWAHQLAGIVGLDVAPIPAIERIPGDFFAAWEPTDDNGWRLSHSDPLSGEDLARCLDGASSDWTGVDGAYVQVYWVRCEDPLVAFAFQQEKWQNLKDVSGLQLAFGAGLDRVSRYPVNDSVDGVARSWVQGNLYVNVQTSCPAGDSAVCATRTATYAHELAALLPGDVTPDTSTDRMTSETALLVLAVPIGTMLVLFVPQRLYFWARSRGYSADGGADFTSVDSLVRRVRITRIIRRLIVTALAITAWFLTWDVSSALGLGQLAWVFLSPFLLFFVFSLLLRLVWRPHPLIRAAKRRGRPSALSVLGSVVRGIATLIAGVSVVSYFFSSMLLIADRFVTPATIQSSIDLAFAEPWALPPYTLLMGMRFIVHALDSSGTYVLVFFVLLAVPVTVSYFIDRFGQRLARRGLQQTLATDDRPYFLYLRGFDEDRLRIDESVGRRGFLELFTPFGRPRFEEVLVEYLSLYGPVIAIAGSRQVLSDLGAAKISLGNDEWRDRVIHWSQGARAVVMSATPREVRAGLEWEMQHVAARAENIRILLVVSPWSRREVARRWAGFLERAGNLPVFRALAVRPMPSGVQVMTYSPGRGWHGYGSRRRWDWSYAASIVTAMDNGDLDVPDGASADAPATVEAS